MTRQPRPTDEEFAELARRRDEAAAAAMRELCRKWGWDPTSSVFHASGSKGCYCDCPDGPCQHIWDGPGVPIGLEEGEDESQARGWSVTCSRCGLDAMSHDIRCAS